ncbi:hypothetical protein MXB_5172 [Myxobolus squamalis]|nr:hypothetical protein MXB_5172 [Myxobolus squamalis]
MLAPLFYILTLAAIIYSQDQIEDYLEAHIEPEIIIYTTEDADIVIHFNDPINNDNGSLYINMVFDSTNLVTLAKVDKSYIKIYTNPIMFYIKNLTTTFLEFRWIPIDFDDAEVYILTKKQTADKKFEVSIIQKYRIIVKRIITTIKCNCTPNYLHYYHKCQCLIHQKPPCEIVVTSAEKIAHDITTHSTANSYDFHDLQANVTIYRNYKDIDVRICVKYSDIRRSIVCDHYRGTIFLIILALRFPRTLSGNPIYIIKLDVLVNYILLPILIFFFISGIFFAILRWFNLIGNNKKKEFLISMDSKNHAYERYPKKEKYPYYTDSEEILTLLSCVFEEKENKYSDESFFQPTKNESALYFENFSTKEIHVENPFRISAT